MSHHSVNEPICECKHPLSIHKHADECRAGDCSCRIFRHAKPSVKITESDIERACDLFPDPGEGMGYCLTTSYIRSFIAKAIAEQRERDASLCEWYEGGSQAGFELARIMRAQVNNAR